MIINSKMGRIVVGNLLIPLYIFYKLITRPTLSVGNKLVYHIFFDINSATLTILKVLVNLTAPQFNRIDNKILKVGEELWKETLPLQMGSRLYQLQGLKPHTWYEVNISYLAYVCISCLYIVASLAFNFLHMKFHLGLATMLFC